MQILWDFLANNKDAVDTILKVFAFLGITSVTGILGWVIQRWWKQRVRVDVKVFEVITDPAVLLPKLYATENDDSPLADHKIKYQPRDPKRDLQAELKAALNRSRYLLITAPTGYGKTREAGVLAQSLMLEGWRVLRIKTGWLDTPKSLPEELNNNRQRVLLFLDDLNGLFSTGELTQSPRAEQIPMLSQASYHDRLLQVLDMLEGMCTENEIRVIATARSETDQWKLLDYEGKDKLWKRFERVEIPEPADSAIVNLLGDSIKQADLKANPEEFSAIAHRSDGTYRNILLNLRRWRAQNKDVSKDDFTETLNGSWRDIYESAVKRHPAVKYIYEAIDILQHAGIELFPFLVEPTASIVWGGNPIQKFLRERKIRSGVHYLAKETNILRLAEGVLTPGDGQIEARGKTTNELDSFSSELEKLLGSVGKHHKDILVDSFLSFGVNLYNQGNKGRAINLWKLGTKAYPHATFWYNQGVAFRDLKRNEEAEAAYRKAIEINPAYASAYSNLGVLLSDLKRNDEAEAAFRKAIEINPALTETYSNLGVLLSDLKRNGEAEAAYRKAIELNPALTEAYSNLGVLLSGLKRNDEAEAAYRKAIELNPADDATYSNLGDLLRDLERNDEAEAAYRKAIEFNPADDATYSNLGNLLSELKRYDEAEAAFRKAIELNPAFAEAYVNLGDLLSELKRYDEAEAASRKAIELNPALTEAYNNLVILLRLNDRIEDVMPLLEKLIEIDPEDFNPYMALSSIGKQLGKGVLPEQVAKARQFLPEDDWYNRACLESVSDNFEMAFDYLEKAAQLESFNPSWAWDDPDLQWLRDDPRFVKIVGPK